MNQSNFEKVVDFNVQFGVLESRNLVPKPNILNEDPKTVEFCLKLIREEMKELEDAVKEKNMIETVDALGDILYVVYGMMARLGIDADYAFKLIHENNMSKLCQNEDEARRTVQYYEENKEKLGYDTPTYRKAMDNIHWVVYNESTKKVLKSIEYKPVDLSTTLMSDLF
jgi:NTP pyrophosphatase (non-canonical NTP hydrolase)